MNENCCGASSIGVIYANMHLLRFTHDRTYPCRRRSAMKFFVCVQRPVKVKISALSELLSISDICSTFASEFDENFPVKCESKAMNEGTYDWTTLYMEEGRQSTMI